MSANGEDTLAESRVLRTIVTVWGISTLVFAVINGSTVLAEVDHLAGWWNVTAVAFVFVPPPIIAFVARWLSLRMLHALLGGYAVAYAVVVATFVPAMLVEALPEGLVPWPLTVTGLGTVAAALAWRPVFAWSYLLFHVIAMGLVRYLGGGQQNPAIAMQDAFFSIAFVAIFTALALVSLGNGRAVDRAAAAARVAAARASSASARVRERARLDALVHDEVMTTLFYATVGTPELDSAVARQARRALDELGARAADSPSDVIEPAEFVSRLRSATLALSPQVKLDVGGARTQDVPIEVASAFVEAAGEAVRNSLAYASVGTEPQPVRVRLSLAEKQIVATISDKGAGFNPRAVPAHRLGIRVSIEGRLAIVPGCVASVESRIGHGTVVTLKWETS